MSQPLANVLVDTHERLRDLKGSPNGTSRHEEVWQRDWTESDDPGSMNPTVAAVAGFPNFEVGVDLKDK